MEQKHQSFYTFKAGGHEYTIVYTNNEFEVSRGWSNGTGAYNEKDFMDRIDQEIENTMNQLRDLQNARKEFKNISQLHASIIESGKISRREI